MCTSCAAAKPAETGRLLACDPRRPDGEEEGRTGWARAAPRAAALGRQSAPVASTRGRAGLRSHSSSASVQGPNRPNAIRSHTRAKAVKCAFSTRQLRCSGFIGYLERHRQLVGGVHDQAHQVAEPAFAGALDAPIDIPVAASVVKGAIPKRSDGMGEKRRRGGGLGGWVPDQSKHPVHVIQPRQRRNAVMHVGPNRAFRVEPAHRHTSAEHFDHHPTPVAKNRLIRLPRPVVRMIGSAAAVSFAAMRAAHAVITSSTPEDHSIHRFGGYRGGSATPPSRLARLGVHGRVVT